MTSPYRLEDRLPTFEEYQHLCLSVGWGTLNFAAAPASLAASPFGVVALVGQDVVGMGRVVGDGAMYYYIQDVAVHLQHQRRGVGRLIVGRLLDRIRRHASPPTFVGLFAASGTEPWYGEFGFRTDLGLTGMFQVLPVPPDAPEK